MTNNNPPPSPITRRAWVLGVAASVVAAAGGIIAYFFPRSLRDIPEEPVPAGTRAELTAQGFIELPYGRYPAIVISTSDGPAAFSRVCTHFSCTVQYAPEQKQFLCPCHDAAFDGEDGSVISGPPTEPLRRFDLFTEGDTIYLGAPPQAEEGV